MSSCSEVTAALSQITGDQIKVFALVNGVGEISLKPGSEKNKSKASKLPESQNSSGTKNGKPSLRLDFEQDSKKAIDFQLDEDSDSEPEYIGGRKQTKSPSSVVEDYYFAISRHGFWLLDRKLEQFTLPSTSLNDSSISPRPLGSVMAFCAFLNVESVLFSNTYTELFQLNVKPGTIICHGRKEFQPSFRDAKSYRTDLNTLDDSYFPSNILFRCGDRARLLKEFSVFHHTNTMFKTCQIPDYDLFKVTHDTVTSYGNNVYRETKTENAQTDAAGEEEGLIVKFNKELLSLVLSLYNDKDESVLSASSDELCKPPENKVRECFLGYSFWIPKDFVKVDTRTTNCVRFEKKINNEIPPANDHMGIPSPTKRQRDARRGVSTQVGNSASAEEFIEVYIQEEDDLRMRSRSSSLLAVQRAAERYQNKMGKLAADYSIIPVPRRYQKKMNLTGDPASWIGWEIHMNTFATPNWYGYETGVSGRETKQERQQKISIIALRREYIPPVLESHVDFAIIYGTSIASKDYRRSAELLADSLSPVHMSFSVDKYILQARADALLLDEASFELYGNRQKIFPRCMKNAVLFCKSILYILGEEGIPVENGSVNSMFPDIKLKEGQESNLFLYSTQIASTPPTMVGDELVHSEAENDKKTNRISFREAWKERVWYYLAFCVDGGLMPGLLNIKTIATLAMEHDIPIIDDVLENLLYLRPLNGPHQPGPLNVRIQNEELMTNFRCNERVLERLLSTGYIHHLLSKYDAPDVYPRFIVSLLRRTKIDDECISFKFAVCQQIADSVVVSVNNNEKHSNKSKPVTSKKKTDTPKLSWIRSSSRKRLQKRFSKLNGFGSDIFPGAKNPEVYSARSIFIDWNEVSLKMVVPALIEMLHSETLDEKLKIIAVVGLVNFTRKDWQSQKIVQLVSEEILKAGTLKYVSQNILSKHEDLTRHTCSFLQSCCKLDILKQELYRIPKFVEDALSILTTGEYRSIETLCQATSLISTLAVDTRFRSIISDCFGYEKQLDRSYDKIFEQSVSICMLVDLLKDDKRIFAKDPSRDRFFTLVISALKNLSLHHNANRKTIGRLCIPTLLFIIATDEKLVEHSEAYSLVEASFRCICVLTFHRQNCQILKKVNLEHIFNKRTEEGFADLIKNIEYMCGNV